MAQPAVTSPHDPATRAASPLLAGTAPVTGAGSAHRTSRVRSRARAKRRDSLAAAGFLAPVLACLVLLRLLPAASALIDSLYSRLPGSLLPAEFVGLDNFTALFASPGFRTSLTQTLVFNLLVNPIQILAALALAVLMTRRLPGTGLWRTLVFLPSAVPMLGSTIVWGIALRPDGPVNGVLGLFGIGPQPFFTSAGQVLWSLILLASWIGVGYWMMFLIAGIQDIPPVYYEAARIDGAGPVRTFFAVTLPLLRRPLLFVLVADTVANFVLFAPIQVLTNGGPQDSSNLLMYDVFRHAYQLSDPHTAAAELIVLLTIMLAVVALQFRLLTGKETG
ncbi:carbohydrate ABC transporter permease [Micromonospora auratinigra]|uniref:Multiple sugar transport system permease protein n=1 Tax=Micromonospora auratinigra TaxID=261654 RepID=A0A1A8Z9J7_9ACTN|nr:sugar ABC transporter permease [Micromonospora auratinigra]SBT40541.1 multiple sugar transport system permease protein [Micromonospora auratinigra]